MAKRSAVNLERLKELRSGKGFSIEEMSLRLGYEHYQGYYYKERGLRAISADDIAAIAEILEVPVQELFFDSKVTNSETKVC